MKTGQSYEVLHGFRGSSVAKRFQPALERKQILSFKENVNEAP